MNKTGRTKKIRTQRGEKEDPERAKREAKSSQLTLICFDEGEEEEEEEEGGLHLPLS